METSQSVPLFRLLLGLALAGVAQLSAATGTITNPSSAGTVWKDTGGAEIINFCGYIIKSGSTYYWYGWDKYAHTVNCYTSTTLGSNSWTEVTSGGFPMFGSGFHGRPAVIFNSSTNKYVMIVEFSSAVGRNGIQYLTSDAPGGPFVSVNTEDYIFGITMGDMGVFKDDDGSAYLLVDTDDGGNANGTNKIVKLNSSYTAQSSIIAAWTVSTNRTEALAMTKHNGNYILTGSKTAGWNSSETWYKKSATLAGFSSVAWSNTPTAPTSTTSYNTQHDFILKIDGSLATVYMFAGDRWSQDTGVGFGRNAWYPVVFSSSSVPKIIGDDSWTIDPATGILAAGSTATTSVQKDATVKAHFPTTPYGTEAILQVSAQSTFEKQMFIQFSVSGIPAGATIISAQLKLRCSTVGATGRSITAHAVANTTWNETAVTWNTKPALGAALSTQTNHVNGADSIWDVTGAITGNGSVTIGLDGTYSGDTTFSSREGTNAPVLVVYYQP